MTAQPELRRAQATSESALSYSQRALWFLDRVSAGNPAYLIAGAARVRGLDAAALERAALALAARHPPLRTTFHAGPDGPVQRVGAEPDVDLREEDATALDEAALAQRLAAVAHQPFDLENGPPWRLALFALAGGEQALVLSIHHIVSDFWSLAVLLRELGILYGAEAGLAPAELPEPATGFAQVVAAQQARLAGPEGERLWQFWCGALAGVPLVLDLPTDRLRPPVQTYRGGLRRFALAPGPVEALRRLTRRRGATLYMGMLAAFDVLLYRYSGQERLVVGCPTAGRKSAELAGLVGYLVNPVAIAADLRGDPVFGDLLGRVRAAALAAFAHQDYPLPLLVERLRQERSSDRSPVFQVMCVLQKGRRANEKAVAALSVGEAGVRLDFGPLVLESLALEGAGAQLDLSLDLAETERGLSGCLTYNRDLFEAATAARLLTHFEILLTAVATGASGERISGLPLLSPAEAHQLLVEWNAPEAESPGAGLVHERIAAVAARSPAATALVLDEQSMSYGELELRAARIGRHLRALGVGPESLVALLAERSFAMVAALFGIWKAGGAYLPLDGSLPAERLAFLLADAQVAAVLVESRLAPVLAELPAAGAPALVLEELWDSEPASAAGATSPVSLLLPEHPAYVLYTSGSTGKPKGVVIPHGALDNRMHLGEVIHLAPGDGFLHTTTISFDTSIEEIFGLLPVGGRTVLARPGGERDPGYLIDLLRRHEVAHASFNTALLSALLKERSLHDCGSLRTLLTGGEAVPPGLPELFYSRSTAELLNQYGPTEATISVTSWRCPRETRDRVVPIGRPIARAGIYLLDRHLQPVPIGVPGELCIAGICLARGYLGRPPLTAEKFVPSPFSSGGRLYRSGDLARYRTDGAIELLGRIDSQVKVRGFRVELGEVEAALREHPALAGVAVVDREEPGTGSRRLVAYFEARPGHGVTAADLRELLRAKVPGYMIPSAFVALDHLPLSPAGKVDRRALPESSAATAMGEAPRGPLEELLAGIWSDLLGVSEPGREDDFFALGGHSLLAIQVVSRVREALAVELPLKVVFETPTLAGLAAAIERPERPDRPPMPPPPLHREPRDGPLPLSFAQERLWLFDQLQPGSPAYNLPGAFDLRGGLDWEAFAASLRAIVRRHAALRTVFAMVSGQPAQIVSPERSAETWTVLRVSLAGLPAAARDAEVLRLTREEALRPFDLARGPLLRVALLHVEEGVHRALFTMHHIVSDGWSVGVLIRELAALYGAAVAGRPSPLPELPVQYADYAVWQRGWVSGEVLERRLAWWRESLAGIPEVLDLPTDRPRPAMASFRGGSVPLALPDSLVSGLSALGRRRGMTPFMVLLAGLAALLSRLTGEERAVVGSPVANRTHREVEGLIGFFVNALPLPAGLAGDPRFSELLAQVRETALGAYVHQDVPFEKLVEELAPQRSLSWSPLFQVMLALQSTPPAQLALPGLTVSPAVLDDRTEKFDLTLFLTPRGGEMTGVLSYSTDLFSRPTAERFASWFERLLAAAVAEPERRLSELLLIGPEERHQIIGEWNDTRRDFTAAALGVPLCLHRWVEAQARRSPRRMAVLQASAQKTRNLTYGELDRLADHLAEILRARGVGPEARVGVSLERSPTMVVCLLAVLKAGGAVVPLDPDYPGERLRFMLTDARPGLVLCEPSQAAALGLRAEQWLDPRTVDPRTVDPRTARSEPPRRAATPPQPEVGAGNAAYLMYTSGSTGRPKGVVISHGAACNHMLWFQSAFELGAADRILQKSQLSFDNSIWEVFGALMAGARLVLGGQDAHRDTASMTAAIARHRVTALMVVPTLLAALLREPGFATGGSLRVVLTGGEALTPALRDRFLSCCPARLVNAYGPTEAAINSAWDECRRPPDGERRVAIGRPLANGVLHVLGPHLELLPTGARGDLYVGGGGLARGYWERPDLTADRFVPDPFGDGERLYRTGDVARRWADGRIEYLGRSDHQIKLRGQRVELGEIEAALQRLPGIRRAAVVLRRAHPGRVDREAGRAYLAAYVETEEGCTPSAAALRAALRGWLPDALIPSAFCFLDHLPVSPNGKLDRTALPLEEPSGERSAAPASGPERRLAALWTELLGAAEVRADDNFFILGGDSIRGLQLVARARRQGLELTLRQIFEHQTLAEMAQAAVAADPSAEPTPPAPAEPPSPADLPASFIVVRQAPLALHAVGRLEPLDAVALGCLPPALLRPGLERGRVIDHWCEGLPTLITTRETAWGRIGTLLLPRFSDDLYGDPAALLAEIAEALAMAGKLGAQVVSLTGLIPSATDYGRAIQRQPHGPAITTGHATTCATVLLTIERMLQEAGRELQGEQVAFLGLGSIGTTTLRALLKRWQNPAQITLCDLYRKLPALQALADEIRGNPGFTGKVFVAGAGAELPPEVYEASLLIGASNAPNILDIERLRPGTLVVDDSAPPCYDPAAALRRSHERGDLLVGEGGFLHSPEPFRDTVFLPRHIEADAGLEHLLPLLAQKPHQIGGCVVSGLLAHRFPELPPILGPVDAETCLVHYGTLQRLGFAAADLHSEGHPPWSCDDLDRFRDRFGADGRKSDP